MPPAAQEHVADAQADADGARHLKALLALLKAVEPSS